jgi:hypothetical protein
MDIAYAEGAARVTLSRRNLEHLLNALDAFGVAETPFLRRMTDNGLLYIFAEEDQEHYGEREPGPGFDFLGKSEEVPRVVGVDEDGAVKLGFES